MSNNFGSTEKNDNLFATYILWTVEAVDFPSSRILLSDFYSKPFLSNIGFKVPKCTQTTLFRSEFFLAWKRSRCTVYQIFLIYSESKMYIYFNEKIYQTGNAKNKSNLLINFFVCILLLNIQIFVTCIKLRIFLYIYSYLKKMVPLSRKIWCHIIGVIV